MGATLASALLQGAKKTKLSTPGTTCSSGHFGNSLRTTSEFQAFGDWLSLKVRHNWTGTDTCFNPPSANKKPTAGATTTAALILASCTQTGTLAGGSNWSPCCCFTKSHSGAVGLLAQNCAIRARSGVPPISTSVVNPPRENPNMPMRSGSI